MHHNLTTITVELGFLGDFVLLLLKTCSLYHKKVFIQKGNDISSQVFNNFFQPLTSWRLSEAVFIGMNARLRDTSYIVAKYACSGSTKTSTTITV